MKKSSLYICLLGMVLTACVSSHKPLVGKGSSLFSASGSIVLKLKERYNITGKSIQVSQNNFWERNTHINLPFSVVLSDTLSSALSEAGARITVQEIGKHPLILVGDYQLAKENMMITVRLRTMGDSASTDLAVVQERIPKTGLDKRWLKPEFPRIARTLVRELEADYTRAKILKLKTLSFKPAISTQSPLLLGKRIEMYLKEALASSPVFGISHEDGSNANAVLTGDYAVMENKLVFHTVIKDKKTRTPYASARFKTELSDIPGELLEPKIQSLDDLAFHLQDAISNSVNLPANKPYLLYIGKKSFYDATHKAVMPFSYELAEKLNTLFSKNSGIRITDSPKTDVNLILSGRFSMENDAVTVYTNLDEIKQTGQKRVIKNLSQVQEKIRLADCLKEWFDVTLKGKTDYLMQILEKKSLPFLAENNRSEILINRFRFENSRHHSKFSDYLESYFLDYFTTSIFFSPVKNLEERLSALKKNKTPVLKTKNTGATVAALADAPFYIDGTFWPNTKNQIEIKAVLASVNGRILGAEHITIDNKMIQPDWISQFQSEKSIHDLDEMAADQTDLRVELFTQKGRNNVSFKLGEAVRFFAKVNKTAYVKIFSEDADHQIFRIYPNLFTRNQLSLKAGVVTMIPDDSYAETFRFEVQGKTGYEMIFAFVSDQPLPELPGLVETPFFGIKQSRLDVKDIKNYFSEYARQNGGALSWDSLAIRTFP